MKVFIKEQLIFIMVIFIQVILKIKNLITKVYIYLKKVMLYMQILKIIKQKVLDNINIQMEIIIRGILRITNYMDREFIMKNKKSY